MRRIWEYTVGKTHDIYNCEHTLLHRGSKTNQLRVIYYYTKGKAGAGMWETK